MPLRTSFLYKFSIPAASLEILSARFSSTFPISFICKSIRTSAKYLPLRLLSHFFQNSLFQPAYLHLADAKLLRRLFLGNAPLFAQQGNDAVKFHCHLVAILHTLPERSAQRPHRVCTASPGCRNRTFRRFLQHLRGRHAPAVLFSALRVCTAACRLTPCRACGR